ncbi:hypothetical protein EYF80_052323 [Liparis tanakae]|uniref:Uncharacterized protein n=1 Tax=Liparis tanakae TaxID=230148 RepID=A0A4Z2F962_9TELE|nr:hypothetical protein EYF80_052323 [Liparis tanakae]
MSTHYHTLKPSLCFCGASTHVDAPRTLSIRSSASRDRAALRCSAIHRHVASNNRFSTVYWCSLDMAKRRYSQNVAGYRRPRSWILRTSRVKFPEGSPADRLEPLARVFFPARPRLPQTSPEAITHN